MRRITEETDGLYCLKDKIMKRAAAKMEMLQIICVCVCDTSRPQYHVCVFYSNVAFVAIGVVRSPKLWRPTDYIFIHLF